MVKKRPSSKVLSRKLKYRTGIAWNAHGSYSCKVEVPQRRFGEPQRLLYDNTVVFGIILPLSKQSVRGLCLAYDTGFS
ncbi:uncharacterized protein APUU_80145S [Aspergillus puulaauensis]|uniref:Uncharacterized protein n=1 Tax=Aspergillus puulaauensis TaxID=1220207 RepID=A0A7R7XY23_9EURO|nr:uncharacterized protein APUU_80145S [Aspergillus puulaauensis]BCS29842.1 hypothetical protein APUU_80145S [Aspergillus puulaauensis]